jgi:hypothetical protein
MPVIRAIRLEQWAGTLSARHKIGELIRKLIFSGITLENINYIRFLAEESSQLSGWDGVLNCKSDVLWIPNNTSVWELGTGSDAKGKIKRDFADRKEKELPEGWIKEKTTYVGATLRKIDDLTSFENELKEDSPWYDVKIYDSTTFEEWIQNYISVQVWLQEQGVGPQPSIHTLERMWQNWSRTTQPVVKTDLILADRENIAKNLLNALKGSKNNIIHIKADSPEEACAFVYSAFVHGFEDEFYREYVLSNTIVINRSEDAVNLRGYEDCNIILLPPATEKSMLLANRGYTVINALGYSSSSQRIDFDLGRPGRLNFSKSLVKMGKNQKEAEIEARACGGSPSVWRVWNLLNYGDISTEIPEWADASNASIIIPAVLIGAWSEKYKEDKEIIKEMSGMEYDDYIDALRPFMSTDNPFIIKINDVWKVIAPPTAFALVITHINTRHLKKLSNIVTKVFKEIDPTLELSADERSFSSMDNGHGLSYSSWLRDGLAESLLRIIVLGKKLEDDNMVPDGQSVQEYVDSLISNLPGLYEDPRVLISLQNQMPALAEAAPGPFLTALERLLQGPTDKMQFIFDEGEHLINARYLHTHLLWALEALAWEPGYLARVALILVDLAKIDPGGSTLNRPINSLREILLPWHPGTNANLNERIEVLDLIIKKDPEVGWKVMKALMPSSHQVSNPIHKPLWKDFGNSRKTKVKRSEIINAYQEYIKRALDTANDKPERWLDLIDYYINLPDMNKKSVEEGLIKLSEKVISENKRKLIWDKLRVLINQNKKYSEASWALPKDRLERLNEILDLYKPHDSMKQIEWLFNDYYPDLPYPYKNYDREIEKLKEIRESKINDLWQKEGEQGLFKLINEVEYPELIATVIINVVDNLDKVYEIFINTNMGSERQRRFSSALSGVSYNRYGESWLKKILSYSRNNTVMDTVNALLPFPDSKNTYEFISSLGIEVEEQYWKRRPGIIRSDSEKVLKMAIDNMVDIGKRAIDIIPLLAQNIKIVSTDKIFKILELALNELNEGEKPSNMSDLGYWIEKLFNLMYSNPEVDKFKLAKYEYSYVPFLTRGFDKKRLALHELLASSPEFFITLICDLYKPHSGERDSCEDKKNAKIKAEFAWKILNSWDCPPGVSNEGKVDGEELRKWVEAARESAVENDRLAVAEQHIGNVLFYLPEDPDDHVWPHKELRKLIEEIKSDNIEKGIEIEQFNSRGTFSKAMFEGGKQEREIARKWKERAEKMGLSWPRTRALLERIADSWERQAEREDELAEKDRLRFD